MSESGTDRLPQISTLLWITGDGLDPDAWTRTGLSPIDTGLRGQYFPGKHWPVPETFWELGFRKKREDCIEGGLQKLLDSLWSRRASVSQGLQGPDVSGTFASNVTIRHIGASYCIGAETLERLAYFGIDYGIDIFDYRDSKRHLPPRDIDIDTDRNPLAAVTSAFVIEGNGLDLAALANATGLMPMDQAVHGPAVAQQRAPGSTLVLDLRHQRLENIDDGVSELLDMLWSFQEPLARYLTEKSLTGRLISSVSIHQFRPVYELKAESLRRMAALKLGYCLEVFDYRDEKVIRRMEDDFPGWRPPPPRANLVVVFKEGVSAPEMDRFLGDAILTEDDRGRRFFRAGIFALTRIAISNHAAYRIAFQETATPQQRDDIKQRAGRSPVVYQILENVERGEIKLR
jgi:hypothetical protein